MATIGEQLAARVLPPRRGAVLALTVDSTARSYALGSLAFGGHTPAASPRRNEVYLTLQADGGAIYFYFHSSTDADLNEATVIAAGGTLAFNAAYCAVIEDGQTAQVCIDRALDKYLVVKGTGTLRLYASSEAA